MSFKIGDIVCFSENMMKWLKENNPYVYSIVINNKPIFKIHSVNGDSCVVLCINENDEIQHIFDGFCHYFLRDIKLYRTTKMKRRIVP